jgi:sulfoxide reductase heme-binding subunit YedZ
MLRRRWIKAVVFPLCLTPISWVLWRAFYGDGLTANPVEFVTHFTGDWTIRFIVITLAVSPLRKLLALPDLIRFRRMLGLFAFFYGTLHCLTYFWLDKFFSLPEIAKDVVRRPFITAGFTAFALMLPLALTSTAGWIRRLGGTRWRTLHRLIYLTAIAAVVHYYWLVKSDIRLPAFYGALVAVLLGWRAVAWLRKRRSRQPSALSTQPSIPQRGAGGADELSAEN